MHIRNLISAICLLLISMVSVGQQITIDGKFTNSPDPVIVATMPVNGNQFSGAKVDIPMDTITGDFKLSYKISQPGFVTLTNNWQQVRLYVQPGKSYHLTADMQDFNTLQITGAEQEGQVLLQQLGLSEDTRGDAAKLDSMKTVTSRIHTANTIAQEKKAAITKLKTAGKISAGFYNAVNDAIDLYRVNLLSTNFFFEFRQREEDPAAVKEFIQTYLPEWKKLYTNINANHNWLHAAGYPSLLGRYNSYQDIADSGRLVFGPGNYALNNINQFRQSLKGSMLEYAWAEYMVMGIGQQLFEAEWIDNFAAFKKAFPASALTSKLQPYITKVVAYQEAAKKKDPAIQLLPGYESMQSMSEVFAALKGKVTYIDLWATWCVPCRAELQYSIKLHDTLKTLGVQTVYISLDVENADKKWKEMIQQLPLKGINLRTNNVLHKDVNKVIPQFTGIPRYLILDKAGNVVEWDAKRPSDKLDLIKQLKTYLN